MPAVAGGAVESISADALRQYRIDLASNARRYRHYPSAARSRGQEGLVALEVLLAPGRSPVVRMAGGSGHALLDEQGLAMADKAVRVTAIPEGLRGREVVVPMPIRFSLESD